MKHLFTQTTFECSKLITQRYSTSFTLGIKTLDKRFHDPIYGIYGYVRYADEIVDTFHDHDKPALLKRFREDTYKAFEEKISLNPVLHAFQQVVSDYKIERELVDAFLNSMEMDLKNEIYNQSEYEQYIYGSAEVVGLMCLRVFCEGNEVQYNELKPYAKRLGAAFQKVNFLRDIKSDFKERGRVYFPGINFNSFTQEEKSSIEKDISEDFRIALQGIKKLPKGSRSGVYLAYIYYLQLFKKIKNLPPSRVLRERIRVPDFRKILLLFKTLFLSKLNYLG